MIRGELDPGWNTSLFVVIVQQVLDHVRSIQPVPKSTVVITRSNTYFVSFVEVQAPSSLPEMTAILPEPCSSLAIRSASSIRSVPTPYLSACHPKRTDGVS